MLRRFLTFTLSALALGVPAGASAAPSWRLEQPAPPAGAPFKVPLGAPGDLQFWSPTRGILALEGNAVIPRGLMFWNGQDWRRLSTVCGGSADTLRVAWAGPTEFWTVSEPSRPRVGSGTTLCRYQGGRVVGSFGTLPQSSDPYNLMVAATCRSANDCWFGGPSANDPAGARTGAFRLHWNGSTLTTWYGPQGRGISDLEAHGDVIYESAFAGSRAGSREPVVNRIPEPVPALLRRIGAGAAFSLDPFKPAPLDDVAEDGSELLALDSDGSQLWGGGGGAASGPSAPVDGSVERPPLLVRIAPGSAIATEITPLADAGVLGPTDRVGDIAAIPQTDDAMLALASYAERRATNVKARVGRIDAATGRLEVTRLPASGAGRGAAARIACPAVDQCWMVTTAGWVFHYHDGTPLPADEDPAFAGVITDRPNEAAAQFIPDTPPVDDSMLFAPPVIEEIAPPVEEVRTRRLAPLMRNLRSKLHGTTLHISFRLTRRAKIGVVAKRKRKTVARAKQRWLKKGNRTVKVRLDRRRWPTKLDFKIVDPALPKPSGAGGGGGDDEVMTTGRLTPPSAQRGAAR